MAQAGITLHMLALMIQAELAGDTFLIVTLPAGYLLSCHT